MANFRINEKIDNYSPNYLASICKISQIRPIVNSDNLQMCTVNGHDIIISKNYKEGDIVIYFPCESAICEKYLSANNLYEVGECNRNSNSHDVIPFRDKAQFLKMQGRLSEYELYNAEVKKRCGFFNKHGRVCLLKLRGEYSDGFVAGIDSMEIAYPELNGTDWSLYLGTQFNEVNGEILCWKFIPIIKEVQPNDGQRRWRKHMKKLKRFDRLVDGQYQEHFDTLQLAEHIKELNPDDVVHISVKIHGSLGEFCNILVKRQLTRWEKVKKFFGYKIDETEYGIVYSSHHVIKNRYINPNVQNFYTEDIWGSVNKVFSQYIPKNVSVYGEICGYVDGSTKFIQTNHDYGAEPRHWRFMPYRMTTNENDGTKYEWNVGEVEQWVANLLNQHPEMKEYIMPLTTLYHGRLGALYPDIIEDENWHENILARMKTDFGLEKNEPLCKNKVPREGIVIRKDNDKYPRAWKLKSMAHYALEKKQHDSGEADIEELS